MKKWIAGFFVSAVLCIMMLVPAFANANANDMTRTNTNTTYTDNNGTMNGPGIGTRMNNLGNNTAERIRATAVDDDNNNDNWGWLGLLGLIGLVGLRGRSKDHA